VQNVAVKAVVTPLLIGGATLAGRRWGNQLGGWLVALPLTSGPVAFLLTTDHGADFAAKAVVGMLAGTISQVAFALAYRALARRGRIPAFLGGCLGFAVSTVALAHLHRPALPTFGIVLAVLSHHAHGPTAAIGVLEGLVIGLLAPAVFFLAVALALPALGLPAFASATVAAVITQASTMLALPQPAPR
jgi:hypothetical protein